MVDEDETRPVDRTRLLGHQLAEALELYRAQTARLLEQMSVPARIDLEHERDVTALGIVDLIREISWLDDGTVGRARERLDTYQRRTPL